MATRIVRRSTSSFPSEMLSLRDMMGRLMENAFVSPEQWFGGENYGRLPAVDLSEDNDNYVIRAELPGWKPEDIDITCEGNTVSLSGQWNEEAEEGEPNTRWHHREMRHGSFQRSISLPTDVQVDKAQADFENGVLTLTLPKSEAVKPKQIKIGGKQGNGQKTLTQGKGSQGNQ